jgi:hypothetical protein
MEEHKGKAEESVKLLKFLWALLSEPLHELFERELLIMAQITVGDPNATLAAVEKKAGVPIPITGTLNWSISPSDGSVAELAPGTVADTMLFVAKAAGTAVVSVVDPQFSLTGTISIDVLAPPPPVPDSLEITFTPGS